MRKLEIEECLNQIEFAANALEVIQDQIICSSNSMNSEVLGQALYGLANTINSQVKKAMDLVFETSPVVGGGARNEVPNQFKDLTMYVFSFENFNKYMDRQWRWTTKAEGMPVSKILSPKNAVLQNGYIVKPNWCKEIKEVK